MRPRTKIWVEREGKLLREAPLRTTYDVAIDLKEGTAPAAGASQPQSTARPATERRPGLAESPPTVT